MKIYSVKKDISFHSKYANNPILHTACDVTKIPENTAGASILKGIFKKPVNVLQQTQDIFKKAENVVDSELNNILENHPMRDLLMSNFDSDTTAQKVLDYANKYRAQNIPSIISQLPTHNDTVTNASIDLICKYIKLFNVPKSTFSLNFDIITEMGSSSPVTLKDVESKNEILDLIDKRSNPDKHINNISTILQKTNSGNKTIIAKLVQRDDISLLNIVGISYLMHDGNEKFISELCDNNISPSRWYITTFDLITLNIPNVRNLKLAEQINLLNNLQSIPAEIKPIYAKLGYDIDYHISAINKMLGEKVPVVSVPLEIRQGFMSAFLSNNNAVAENILKTHDFSQYGKEGIPLKYSRKGFCKNINTIISELTLEEQNMLLNHYGLKKGQNYVDGTVSYDGILNNRKYDDNSASTEVKEAAHKISEEIEKFTVNNETLFEDTETKNFFDAFIKGLPEFTEVIGKEQHYAHEYSVDIHTLKVLQSAMNNPLYSTLSDKDKMILKMSVLLHDIGKPNGRNDETHANTSAYYADGILDQIKLPADVKNRIIEIVQNHHWFETYNKGFTSVEDIAVRCIRPDDFKIYQIMAKADLENVSKYFHLGDKTGGARTQAEFDKYMEEKMKPIDNALNQVYSRHNPVFCTRFIGDGKLFPIEKVQIGKEIVELRALDLNKLSDNASLEQYGFPPGTTKENLRFLVHMTRPNTSNLESVIYLTKNHLQHNTWSTSIIKPSNNVTYENNKYGFVFNADQANFADAYFENIASGNNKTLESFRDILFGKIWRYELGKLGVNLTYQEQKQLHEIIAKKGYLLNINEDIVIGDKTINQKQFFEACGGDSWLYLRNIMLENLKKEGFNLNENEYADLTKYLLTKKYLTQISKPNLKGELNGQPVIIGKHIIPATTLVDCLNKTLDRLFDGEYVQSEVIVLDPIPTALIALDDSLEKCPNAFLQVAKKYKDTLPVIILKDSLKGKN